MKLLFVILLSITATTCKTEPITSVEYWAASRGYYKHIRINAQEITISNTPEHQNPIRSDMNASDWKRVTNLLPHSIVERLQELEPPSTESHTDGALSARFVVNTDSGRYETMDFDHGNPPETIQEIVTLIQELVPSD